MLYYQICDGEFLKMYIGVNLFLLQIFYINKCLKFCAKTSLNLLQDAGGLLLEIVRVIGRSFDKSRKSMILQQI